jgi:hypothetical protein
MHSSRENNLVSVHRGSNERSYAEILMFTVNTTVQEVLANVKSLIPISGREVIEGLQSSVVNMEKKFARWG